MGYLIFQITLFTYILATAGYIVYFWSQRNEIRTAARRCILLHEPISRYDDDLRL